MSDIYVEVQAALLNSSGEPEDEIKEAMRAVVEFALLECEATPEHLHQLVDQLVKRVERES